MRRDHMMPDQLGFDFSTVERPAGRPAALWTVDEIYRAGTNVLLAKFAEDRRLERKSPRIQPQTLGE